MKSKIFKGFFAYSYITLLCYVGSENALTLAKAMKGMRGKERLEIESLWKTTLKRFEEVMKLIMED